MRRPILHWLLASITGVAIFASLIYMCVSTIPKEEHTIALAGTSAIFLVSVFPLILLNYPPFSYLKLTKAGIEAGFLWKKSRLRWDEIDHFEIVMLRGKEVVAFNLKTESDDHQEEKKRARKLLGQDGAIIRNYGVNPRDLKLILDQWKEYSKTDAKP